MKNLVSVVPLFIVRKSSSGLAVQVTTRPPEARQRGYNLNDHWLPLSQVVIKTGRVIAVPLWLVNAKGLERAEVGEAW